MTEYIEKIDGEYWLIQEHDLEGKHVTKHSLGKEYIEEPKTEPKTAKSLKKEGRKKRR